MKLPKKEEAALLKVYDTWWDSYLNGDVETYDSFLDKDFRFVGSTGSEEFLNRKDTTAFFEATAEQLAGNAKVENVVRTIEPLEGMVLITDLADTFIKDGNEWAYYARFRFTSLLRKTENGWRFFYQHFSTPDLMANEGETIGIDKVRAENLELRTAIKRRTAELELKNRELEVEAALERIRAQVTAMSQSSDLLDIVVAMRTEFVNLGHEAHYFWHMRWLPDMYQKAMTSGDGARIGMIMELPRDFHSHYEGMDEWENNEEPIIVLALETEIAVDYVDKMIRLGNFQQVDPNAPSLDDVRHIGGLTFISAKTTHGEIGYSLPGVVKNPPKEDLDILVRLAATFDLANKRFEDLRRSEQQYRETQIELALEKVRARTMAMHKSEDLHKIANVVLSEMEGLDIQMMSAMIHEYQDDSKDIYFWAAANGVIYPDIVHLPYKNNQFTTRFNNARDKGLKFFSDVMVKAEKNKNWRHFFKHVEVPQERQKYLLDTPAVSRSIVFFENTAITILRYEDAPFSESQNVVLKRFGQVFQQAYTRFLDLQKAEEQAREAQIEAALEKVRTRSMAMHQSDELKDVIKVIFNQMSHLNINAEHAGIVVDYEPKKDWHFWVAEKQDIPARITVPYLESDWDRQFTETKKKGKDFFTTQLDFEEKNSFYKDLLPHIEGLTKKAREFYFSCPGLAASTVIQKDIGLYIENFSGTPYTDDENNILMRFGKVCQQTYTRFLDLQKAEAQVREAHIEAALERTRTQSMLMQHSDELIDISKVFHEQLLLLEIPSEFSYVWLPDEANDKHLFWATWAESEKGSINLKSKALSYELDRNEPYTGACLKAWKNQEVVHEDFIPPKDISTFFDTWKELLLGAKKLKAKNFHEGMYYAEAYMKYGCFGINIRRELSDEEKQILARFSREFERAYTRFLDLQKAEAQTREAQIEAALERVRARTMAMQKSEELADVATVLFQQIGDLGIPQWTCGFNIWEPGDTHFTFYPGGPDGEILESCKVPLNEHHIFRQFDESKKRGEELLVYEKEGEIQADHYKYMHSLPGIGDMLQGMLDKGLEFPSFQIDHVANFLYGNIIFITYEPFPEMHDVFIRFAKVFEQTYTRFLDLQKAEGQAREAQINLAVERVRAKALAMHKSAEIMEVVAKLKDEVMDLEIPDVVAATIFLKEGEDKVRMWDLSSLEKSDDGYEVPLDITFKLKKSDPHLYVKQVWDNPDNYFVEIQDEKGFNRIIAWLREHDKNKIAKEVEEFIETTQLKQLYHAAKKLNSGKLCIDLLNPPLDEMEYILTKMGAAFDLAYKRFEDLQKAEEQAREAQIETALEKVRSRTMAMQKGEELKDVVVLLYKELIALGVTNFSTCGYVEINEETSRQSTWVTSTGGDSLGLFYLPLTGDTHFDERYEAWKKRQIVFHQTVAGNERRKHLEYAITTFNSKEAEEMVLNQFPDPTVFYCFNFSHGYLHLVSGSKLKAEEESLLARFTKVFEQTYARFLDLKKAEAQAREAKIEAALERVRSKTMAMHNSKDVEDIVVTLFDEVLKLGIDKSIRCGIGILEATEKMKTWSANRDPNDEVALRVGLLGMDVHPMLVGLKKAWKSGEKDYSYEYTREDVKIYYKALNDEPDYPFNADLRKLHKREFHKSFFFSSGILFSFSENPISDEASRILSRFADVFGQTYRRYLDLKKAEGQAREAQIEAALEKVRSRTMAMQSSTELVAAANLLFKQVRDLGINAWSAGYNVLSEDKTQSKCWMSSEDQLQAPFPLYYTEEASFIEMGEFLKSDADFYVQELKGKAIEQHYDYMKSLPELKETFKHLVDSGLSLPTYQINHLCKFTQGYLLFITYEKSPEAHDIFKRFTKVFEQTYTRFLDLQKAENQSKEAQISLALERVRASSMAMHKSEQLAETAQTLFEQFDLLGVVPDRMSIAIINEKKSVFEFWATDQNGKFVNHVHDFSFNEPTCIAKAYKAWKENKETCIVDLKGKELKNWIQYVKEEAKMEIDDSKFKGRRLQNFAFFSQGGLNLSSHLPISEEVRKLLQRFAKVFQQSYTRFLDLQKSEAQAREAVIHASVDRVRAEIASMRTSNDLKRITPLVWNELTKLGVPFIRCGVFIIDEEKQQVQTHLSTPDGKAIASFELSFENTEPLTELLPYWRNKEVYKDYWDEAAFIESTKILMERGALTSSENFITEHPPTNLYLHFLPFAQGMLYVGSEVPLNDDELSLAQNLADAFSTAYSRYEDFNKLESANKKIEKTLVDLKQTQTQLVQSEKMASLGELTAGIAHEIQNPLNFVNNFSEVSAELVEEMNEEIEEGNLDFAKEIADDLKQNLEKINHHGKRAGEIVKGMLQHSRTSSGKKELTDINALADEYLRLAYHGLRAKDKTFNSKMESDFDPDIPKLEVIPQDIGRVILNLINNAFYAVNERSKMGVENYEPKVEVITRRANDTIEILVSDNGNGMPEHVKEKVFQPFFTTKPTGKGTGLGLSLSYDIITAHGGELKVETKEEVGTTFIIQLTTL